MSISLFDLDIEYLELERMLDTYASENEGDITDFPLNDEFERLKGERVDKLLNVGAWIKSLEAEIDAHKAEQKRQGEKVRVLSNRAVSLKILISSHLTNGEKLHDTRVALSYRKSERVIVNVLTGDLPKEYVVSSTTTAPDKKAIKALLKSEQGCEFAHMEISHNLQIK